MAQDLIKYMRSFRIGEFAVFDFVASFLVFYVVMGLDARTSAALILPLSMLAHLAAGNITPMTQRIVYSDDMWSKLALVVSIFALTSPSP